MDRRVSIIRFWLLAAFVAYLTLAAPAMAVGLWPVLFLFPGCVCCGEPLGSCECCNTETQPEELQMVIDGVADAFCSTCDGCNATYVLTRGVSDGAGGFGPTAPSCFWGYVDPTATTCCAGASGISAFVWNDFSPPPGSNCRFVAFVANRGLIASNPLEADFSTGFDGVIDCTDIGDKTFSMNGLGTTSCNSGASACCDSSSATCDITVL